MDRFIANKLNFDEKPKIYLKSNMDRFIGGTIAILMYRCAHLKSNMDRFIVLDLIEFDWDLNI